MTPVGLSLPEAADGIERALLGGTDPENEPLRTATGLARGQLLFMPASDGRYVGAKLLTIRNPTGDATPRINGIYALFDAATLRLLATFDGAAVTALRTPAVSTVAARRLVVPGAKRLVLFGTGPQAWGHLAALRAVRPITQVVVVGRDAVRLAAFVARCRQEGVPAGAGIPDDVADADVVACCTTAREPLFDGSLPPPHCAVIAIGSHEPVAREVDEALIRRSTVVVEARTVAGREAGDLLITQAMDAVAGNLAELVRGEVPVPEGRPRLFKSVGMAWQDLIVAGLAYEAESARQR